MPVTIPQDEVMLLSYFQTGDKPTQDQFGELIGTMFYQFQSLSDRMDALELLVADAIARAPQALASALWPGAGTIYTLEYQVNVAQIQVLSAPTRFRITFIDPMPDTDYVVLPVPFSSTANVDQNQILDRQLTYCDVAFYDGVTAQGTTVSRLHLAIYRE